MTDPFSDSFPEMIPPSSGPVPNPVPSGYEMPEVDAVLVRLRSMIESSRPVIMSASSMINKEEVLRLIDELTVKMPDELRAARWLLKERQEFLAKVRSEADDILEAGRVQAEQMVQRTEVVRSAEQRARQVLTQADTDARRMKRDAEDYCDQKLGSFEIILEKTLGIVGAGRAKLQGNPLAGLSEESLGGSSRGAQPTQAIQPNTHASQPEPQHLDPMTGQHAMPGEFYDQSQP